jgi:hypothetical protein
MFTQLETFDSYNTEQHNFLGSGLSPCELLLVKYVNTEKAWKQKLGYDHQV